MARGLELPKEKGAGEGAGGREEKGRGRPNNRTVCSRQLWVWHARVCKVVFAVCVCMCLCVHESEWCTCLCPLCVSSLCLCVHCVTFVPGTYMHSVHFVNICIFFYCANVCVQCGCLVCMYV